MSKIEELLRRVEASDGPDRELDLEILRATSGHPWQWRNRKDETITWEQYGPDALGNPICSLEAFTESIDDAISLCEGALSGCVIRMGTDEGPCWVCINGLEEQAAEAKTLPLALCAAILKAVASRGQP